MNGQSNRKEVKMFNLTQTQFYLLVYVVLVLIAGIGEYVHLVPSNTFSSMLFVVAGHAAGVFSPSPMAMAPIKME
jgi:hypothetical protein